MTTTKKQKKPSYKMILTPSDGGDLIEVKSRNLSQLVGIAYDMMRVGYDAQITGRQTGYDLIGIVDKLAQAGAETPDQLTVMLNRYTGGHVSAIAAIARESETIKDLKFRIAALFGI
jgi:hypothetical protein